MNQLNAAEEDYSDLIQAGFDHMDEGISIYDRDLNLVAWNKAFVDMIGLPADLLVVGQPIATLIQYNIERGEYGEGDPEEILSERLALLEDRVHKQFDRVRDDSLIVNITWIPLPNDGLVITYRDVTERRKAALEIYKERDRAQDADRAKSEFLAGMSHELRTPLNAIIGFSEIIAGEHFGPTVSPKYRSYAMDIQSAGHHLLELINGILDLAKVESGSEELIEENVDITALLNFVLGIAGQAARDGSIELEVKTAENLPQLYADKRMLNQILLNLITNAIKFNHQRGRVIITVSCSNSGMKFEVIDNGIGISSQDMSTAMSRFGQVAGALSREHEGSGLGLPLTKSLIELHGGSLDITSAPGQGTTATIRFPSRRTVHV